jgi:hypothetical protein
MVPARTPGDRELPVLEETPGSYAMLRLGAEPPSQAAQGASHDEGAHGQSGKSRGLRGGRAARRS